MKKLLKRKNDPMKHQSMNNFVGLFLSLFVLCVALTACNVSEPNRPTDSSPESSNEQNSPVVATLHAAELVKEFEGNEVRANQLYKNKRVRIYGTVNSIENKGGGQIALTFKSSVTTYSMAQCLFSDSHSAKLAEIRSNNEATVEGTVRGYDTHFVTLESCTIP
jgi:hypothetical protein